MARKSVSNMTDEELAARAAELAEERTAIRLKQLEVQRELEVREAVKNLSPETRRIVKLGLAGGIASEGTVSVDGGDA